MRSRPDIALLAGVVAFLALLQIVGLWTGAAGIPYSPIVAYVACGVALIGAIVFASRCPGDGVPSSSAPEPQGPPTSWTARAITLGALGWLALAWTRLWLLAWRRAPFDWDGLYYHIPAIHGWVQQGRVGWLETSPDISFVNYPMGVEATSFFLYAVHGSSRLVNACNLWYWPLAVFALVVLARELGARPGWSWLAGALWISAPLVVTQSVTNYTDVAQAAAILAALATTLVLVRANGGNRWWPALLWGGAVGLMAGAKGSGLPAAVIVFVGTMTALAIRERRRLRAWLLPLGGGVLAAAATGAYWYARSILHTGNPVYPIQVKLGQAVILPGYDHVAFSEANLPAWLAEYPTWARMPVAWVQHDAPITGSCPVGGLGFLWLWAGLPAVALLAVILWRRRRVDPGGTPFLLLIALSALLLGAQTATWWSRFTLWLIGLGLPALATLLDRIDLATRNRAIRAVVVLVALGAVGLAGWESHRSLSLEEADGRIELPDGRVTYPSSLQRIAGPLAELPGIDRFLAADHIARSRLGRLGSLLGGALCLPLDARKIEFVTDSADAAEVLALRESGVSWVFWDTAAAGALPARLEKLFGERLSFTTDAGHEYLFLRLK